MNTPKKERLEIIDSLRGIASLGVVWFHAAWLSPGLPGGWLKSSGHYGFLGIHVFFVISGFVIPLSLDRNNYRLGNYGRFLLKRCLRLDPPYLATIVFILALSFFSRYTPFYSGVPFVFNGSQTLAHLAYANVLLGYPWFSPAFWTLAVEFQYYLIIGLLYPVIVGASRPLKIACLALAVTSAALVPSTDLAVHYTFIFLMGVAVFLGKTGRATRPWLAFSLVLCAVCAFFTVGSVEALAGLGTACLILGSHYTNRLLRFFGDISYSLYLVHWPITTRIANLGLRYARTDGEKLFTLGAEIAVSVLFAYALYRLVEVPTRKFAARIPLSG